MRSLTLNLLIALIWLLLSKTPSVSTFTIGYLMGLVLLRLFHEVLPRESYTKRVFGFLRFCLVFAREFVMANVEMVRIVLFAPIDALHPKYIRVDARGLERWEILLLTHCISLTPGSTTVQISEDFGSIIVHALDAADPDAVRRHINETLRDAILEFSRP